MGNNSTDWVRALYEAAHLPDLIAPEVLARHLDVPPDTVLDALKAGDLPGREFDPGTWRITKRAALAWVERRADAKEVSDVR